MVGKRHYSRLEFKSIYKSIMRPYLDWALIWIFALAVHFCPLHFASPDPLTVTRLDSTRTRLERRDTLLKARRDLNENLIN
jgi:hypothetical protein